MKKLIEKDDLPKGLLLKNSLNLVGNVLLSLSLELILARFQQGNS